MSKVLQACKRELPVGALAAHMHDTYGQGCANVLTALALGVSSHRRLRRRPGRLPLLPPAPAVRSRTRCPRWRG